MSPSKQAFFERWPSGKAKLEALEQSTLRPGDIGRIVATCNQPLVYDMLGPRLKEDTPYREQDAQEFVDFATKGWSENKYYVYVVRDEVDRIVGAIDIKSADRTGAEIGYWADTESPGYTSNAAKTLVQIAKNKGYEELFAYVLPSNEKSQHVVERAGFQRDTVTIERRGLKFYRYNIRL